ncbi:YidH family protein [Nocardia sp. CA-290969]|uniref:YidH family protein n=1 Tax=Nocardia sp. CA-290969 TaxID=3239986 RepID=UPI003D91DED6
MVADAGYNVRRRFPMRVYGRGTEPDARFSLANERTYLAWIRTSVALMAAGVALQVFGIGGRSGPGVLASTLLIVCSIVLPGAAWVSWARVERSLREDAPLPAPSMAGPLAVVLAVASGLVLAAILL